MISATAASPTFLRRRRKGSPGEEEKELDAVFDRLPYLPEWSSPATAAKPFPKCHSTVSRDYSFWSPNKLIVSSGPFFFPETETTHHESGSFNTTMVSHEKPVAVDDWKFKGKGKALSYYLQTPQEISDLGSDATELDTSKISRLSFDGENSLIPDNEFRSQRDLIDSQSKINRELFDADEEKDNEEDIEDERSCWFGEGGCNKLIEPLGRCIGGQNSESRSEVVSAIAASRNGGPNGQLLCRSHSLKSMATSARSAFKRRPRPGPIPFFAATGGGDFCLSSNFNCSQMEAVLPWQKQNVLQENEELMCRETISDILRSSEITCENNGDVQSLPDSSSAMSRMKGCRKRKGSKKQQQRSKKGRRRQLPASSVSVLKQWLEQNFEDPYASRQQKMELAHLSGLTYSQVDNWLSNTRFKLNIQRPSRLRPTMQPWMTAANTHTHTHWP